MYVIILLKHILQKLKLEASPISNNFHHQVIRDVKKVSIILACSPTGIIVFDFELFMGVECSPLC